MTVTSFVMLVLLLLPGCQSNDVTGAVLLDEPGPRLPAELGAENDPEVLKRQLGQLHEEKDWERSVLVIERLAQLETDGPTRAKYLYAIALIYRDELVGPDQMASAARRALVANPNLLKAFEVLYGVESERQNWDALSRAFRHVLTHAAGLDVDTEFDLRWNLGLLERDHLKDYDLALVDLRAARELKPGHPNADKIISELELLTRPWWKFW